MSNKIIPILKLAILIMLNVFIIGVVGYVHPAQTGPVAALSRNGSRGDEVKKIQGKLITFGYMSGPIDGIYGPATEAAVRKFQENNGLTADGIAGPATLRAMGVASGEGDGADGGGELSDSDYRLLARIISAESRGESYEGQVAVGAVVLNRVEHPSFPNTISGVVYQPRAFTAVTDGQIDEPVAESCYRAARDALNGWDPSGGAVYYFNPDKTNDQWMRTRPVIKRIGNHLFCA